MNMIFVLKNVRTVMKRCSALTKCLMCDNSKYTWYEVMRDNCGKSNEETLKTLCDVHVDIFREQLLEVMKK